MIEKLNLACDYMQGAHPAILKRMSENNLIKSGVYGYDVFSDSAKAKIREICQAPDADIWFLVGGTQTNATVLDAVTVIETYVYTSMRTMGMGFSTAVGLCQGLMGLILILLANTLAKKINDGEGLF